MAKLLIVNGCGLTWGSELAHPQREAWPAVLGDLLGVPVVNLACGGGSNRRMVRTTAANLDRICREAGIGAEDALVICMWTEIDRTEYFKPRARHRDPGTPGSGRPDLPYESQWFRVGRWRTREDPGTGAYYRQLWNLADGTVNWLLDWVMLDGFLHSRGATRRYAHGWGVLDGEPGEEATSLARQLDPTAVFGHQIYGAGTSFQDICDASGFTRGAGRHPLADAHLHFADLMAKWLAGDNVVAEG